MWGGGVGSRPAISSADYTGSIIKTVIASHFAALTSFPHPPHSSLKCLNHPVSNMMLPQRKGGAQYVKLLQYTL